MDRAKKLLHLRRRWREPGELTRELVGRQHVPVARRLVRGHRILERARARKPFVERRRTEPGIAERVGDPLSGDEVLVVARVANERPARTERLAKKIRHRRTDEAFLASRRADTLRKCGDAVEGLEIMPLDILLVASNSANGQDTMSSVRPSLVGHAAQAR